MARRFGLGNIGLLLTGIWLILWGVFNIPGVSFPGAAIILVIIAIIAGLALIFYR